MYVSLTLADRMHLEGPLKIVGIANVDVSPLCAESTRGDFVVLGVQVPVTFNVVREPDSPLAASAAAPERNVVASRLRIVVRVHELHLTRPDVGDHVRIRGVLERKVYGAKRKSWSDGLKDERGQKEGTHPNVNRREIAVPVRETWMLGIALVSAHGFVLCAADGQVRHLAGFDCVGVGLIANGSLVDAQRRRAGDEQRQDGRKEQTGSQPRVHGGSSGSVVWCGVDEACDKRGHLVFSGD
ncbi:hypothetical protein L1887_56813 [Cichorium endivia]|nr:hypothetical protein L1887_56813 [Cichorium endivia]